MEFKLITDFSDIKPKDVVRNPSERRLYEIVDVDETFHRVLLRFYVTDHEADADRKIMVHQEALLNRWQKMV
ncbi:hypothetical protein RCC89_16825 [Cytophagaceae bacterium ABcell3]|nr:hypothetical protein RCC89_16825 [Cytophagaceae bacterium ABcell3]